MTFLRRAVVSLTGMREPSIKLGSVNESSRKGGAPSARQLAETRAWVNQGLGSGSAYTPQQYLSPKLHLLKQHTGQHIEPTMATNMNFELVNLQRLCPCANLTTSMASATNLSYPLTHGEILSRICQCLRTGTGYIEMPRARDRARSF